MRVTLTATIALAVTAAARLLLRTALLLPFRTRFCVARLGRAQRGAAGFKARHDLHRHLFFHHALDRRQQRTVFAADQRNRVAGAAGTTGAADAVHVIFGHVRQVVVDDMRQCVDVDTACGDVGGDEDLDFIVLEALERAHALRLALVAVDGVRLDTVLVELLGQAVGAMLGFGEHQHLEPVVRLHKVGEEFALAVLVHRVHDLRHQFDRRIAPRDFDRDRVFHEGVGQLADLVREGGREQQVLPLHRQQRHDAADIGQKAHVQHAVGFVEHQDFNAAQVHRALLHVVEQAAGGGDNDVNTAAQFRDLGVEAHAAENHRRFEFDVLAVGLDRVIDLGAQLARRRKDQHAHRMLHRLAVVGDIGLGDAGAQQLQYGQREAGGLSGAGLRSAEQIAPGQHNGNGLRLDGGCFGIALIGDST